MFSENNNHMKHDQARKNPFDTSARKMHPSEPHSLKRPTHGPQNARRNQHMNSQHNVPKFNHHMKNDQARKNPFDTSARKMHPSEPHSLKRPTHGPQNAQRNQHMNSQHKVPKFNRHMKNEQARKNPFDTSARKMHPSEPHSLKRPTHGPQNAQRNQHMNSQHKVPKFNRHMKNEQARKNPFDTSARKMHPSKPHSLKRPTHGPQNAQRNQHMNSQHKVPKFNHHMKNEQARKNPFDTSARKMNPSEPHSLKRPTHRPQNAQRNQHMNSQHNVPKFNHHMKNEQARKNPFDTSARKMHPSEPHSLKNKHSTHGPQNAQRNQHMNAQHNVPKFNHHMKNEQARKNPFDTSARKMHPSEPHSLKNKHPTHGPQNAQRNQHMNSQHEVPKFNHHMKNEQAGKKDPFDTSARKIHPSEQTPHSWKNKHPTHGTQSSQRNQHMNSQHEVLKDGISSNMKFNRKEEDEEKNKIEEVEDEEEEYEVEEDEEEEYEDEEEAQEDQEEYNVEEDQEEEYEATQDLAVNACDRYWNNI